MFTFSIWVSSLHSQKKNIHIIPYRVSPFHHMSIYCFNQTRHSSHTVGWLLGVYLYSPSCVFCCCAIACIASWCIGNWRWAVHCSCWIWCCISRWALVSLFGYPESLNLVCTAFNLTVLLWIGTVFVSSSSSISPPTEDLLKLSFTQWFLSQEYRWVHRWDGNFGRRTNSST